MPRKDTDRRRAGKRRRMQMLGRVGLGYIMAKCPGCNLKYPITNSDFKSVSCPQCSKVINRPAGGWMRLGQGAMEAGRFFHEKWGGILDDGLFWQAVCAYRTGEHVTASELADQLAALNPRYPKLEKLQKRLLSTGDKEVHNEVS